jgi:hypothetical protein
MNKLKPNTLAVTSGDEFPRGQRKQCSCGFQPSAESSMCLQCGRVMDEERKFTKEDMIAFAGKCAAYALDGPRHIGDELEYLLLAFEEERNNK